jgi:hypothetical protein
MAARRAFQDDVLRYSLNGFSLPPLEHMLVQVNRTLKRNKVFDAGRVDGHIVAALDGIEVLSSCKPLLRCLPVRHQSGQSVAGSGVVAARRR